MLRRVLPLWKPAQTIAETLEFCRRTDIAEVIWKVDVHSFNHGFTPLDRLQEYIPWLEEARRQSHKDILFSINPWISRGHMDAGRYPEGPPPGFRWHVRPDGTEAPERACPLSPGWREWLLQAYALYATTKPNKLWVEDDFRIFAGSTNDIGCYCEAHLEAFAERVGERMSRQELVSRITRPGVPDPVRAQWFDFQGQIMVQICRQLEQAVHHESPETRLGLMNSWSTDGRWWHDAILALAGPHRPLARPSLGPYTDSRTTEFISDRSTDHRKEVACLPAHSEICPELENWPHSAFSKSTRMTRMQLAFSQVLGYRGITMNLFDFVGSPIDTDSRLEQMLIEVKPMLDGIAIIDQNGGQPRGVTIPFPARYADHAHLEEGQGFQGFAFDGDGWDLPLQGSGIPIVFNSEAEVCAVTGQSLRTLSKSDIERLLHNGLLLDGSAASVLQKLGYRAQLGVEVVSKIGHRKAQIDAERDVCFGDRAHNDPAYMTLDFITNPHPGQLYPLQLSDRTNAVSYYVNPNHQAVMPGMTLFENDFGGRVAVYPFDLSKGIGVGFMNWQRKCQLQSVVRWLGRDQVTLEVNCGAWMVPIRRDYPDYSIVALLNFENDEWQEVAFSLNWPGGARNICIERLTNSGNLKKIQPTVLEDRGTNVFMRLASSVPALDFVVFRIRKKHH